MKREGNVKREKSESEEREATIPIQYTVAKSSWNSGVTKYFV